MKPISVVPTSEELLSVAVGAVQAAAETIAAWEGRFTVREKGPADLVTDADVASERAIRRVIHAAFPKHDFLGEEGTLPDGNSSLSVQGVASDRSSESTEVRWVADPIDGTTNFAHGFPFYCVSLAAQQNGESIIGAILDPNHGELFTAMKDGGTKRNGELVSAPPCRKLADAILAISLPPRLAESRWEFDSLKQFVPRCRAFRRTGSAALNLCYVAMGRIDAYWASSLNLWDRAAGELFVREVGGVVTDIDGGPLTTSSRSLLAAGDPKLHAQLLDELHEIRAQ